jgi:hypothetical protein
MNADLVLATTLIMSTAVLSIREALLCYRWIRNVEPAHKRRQTA